MHVLVFKFQSANLAILWLNRCKEKKSRQRRVKKPNVTALFFYISSPILGDSEAKVKEEAMLPTQYLIEEKVQRASEAK